MPCPPCDQSCNQGRFCAHRERRLNRWLVGQVLIATAASIAVLLVVAALASSLSGCGAGDSACRSTNTTQCDPEVK